MPKDIIIGVDGGGSKTHCVIIERPSSSHADIRVQDINILADSYSGSTNANSVGDEKAKTELLKAITDALAQIKEEYIISAIGLGMSGVDRPNDKEKVLRWLQENEQLKSVEKVSINNDAVAALCSGTMGRIVPGKSVVVISGTGCICVGYDAQSNWVRAGGWGPLLGDEGSGYAIGSMVLQHVCHQHDGVPSVILGETVEAEPKAQLYTCVLEALKLKDATELIPFVYGKSQEWSVVAAVAPIAFDCAKKGDKLAQLILKYQSQALFKYIERVMHRLATKEQPALIQDYHIVIAGSILTHEHSPITQMVEDLLRVNYPKAKLLAPVVTPAIGSALYAAQN